MKRVVLIAVMAILGSAAAALAQPQTKEPAPRPSQRTPSCTSVECHTKELNHKFQHGPTAVSACDACHTYSDVAAHKFKLKAQGKDLCTFCHIDKAASDAPYLHKPFADGQCLECHDPHGSEVQFNLRKNDVNATCLNCHAAVLEGHQNIHKAVTAGNCTACHNAHSAEHQRLLVKETRDLCFSCHDDVKHQVQTATSFHDPLKPGGSDCLKCHTPHASDTTHQLKAPPAQLCGSCHQDIAKIASGATVPHPAVADGEACLNCHTPHGSEHAKLMKSDQISTCLACHNEKPQAAEAKHEELNPARPVFADQPAAKQEAPKIVAKPVSQLAIKGLNPHGPVAEGKCAACHDVHGASHPKLLNAPFSDQFTRPYSVESFALCAECHGDKMAADATTATATNFRDGERNLHFVHVNKEKGRSCSACHSVHASRFDQQICDTVTYGNWQLPINFKPIEGGGSCAPGCHRAQTYTRTAVKIPVNYPAVPKTQPAGPPAPGE
jgi:predicted CXXCH cytochrome family protein